MGSKSMKYRREEMKHVENQTQDISTKLYANIH